MDGRVGVNPMDEFGQFFIGGLFYMQNITVNVQLFALFSLVLQIHLGRRIMTYIDTYEFRSGPGTHTMVLV